MSAVCVLLGKVVAEWGWGGRRNLAFMRHGFLVLPVKRWLESVRICGGCRGVKMGCRVPHFWTTRYIGLYIFYVATNIGELKMNIKGR